MLQRIAPYLSIALVICGMVVTAIAVDNTGIAIGLGCFTWGVIVEVKLTNDTVLQVLKGSPPKDVK